MPNPPTIFSREQKTHKGEQPVPPRNTRRVTGEGRKSSGGWKGPLSEGTLTNTPLAPPPDSAPLLPPRAEHSDATAAEDAPLCLDVSTPGHAGTDGQPSSTRTMPLHAALSSASDGRLRGKAFDDLRQRHEEIKDFMAAAAQRLAVLLEQTCQQTTLLHELRDGQQRAALQAALRPSPVNESPVEVVGHDLLQELLREFRSAEMTCPSNLELEHSFEQARKEEFADRRNLQSPDLGTFYGISGRGLQAKEPEIERSFANAVDSRTEQAEAQVGCYPNRFCKTGEAALRVHESVLARRVDFSEINGKARIEESMEELETDTRKFRGSRDFSHLREGGFVNRCFFALGVFVRSDMFELMVAAVIIANTIVMAVDMQYKGMLAGQKLGDKMTNKPPSWIGDVIKASEGIFLWLLVVELVLKLVGMRGKFVMDGRRKIQFWNLFDVVVVTLGLIDRLMTVDMGMDPMLLRVARLFRLARFAKKFKVANQFNSLSLILKSVSANRGTLLWAMLLLFMIQCAAGMLVAQMARSFVEDESKNESDRMEVYKYYGTFSKTQFTMFEVTHVDYARAARVLVDNISEAWAWFFVIYRCSVAFALLQVIMAVFIQRTLTVAKSDRDLVIHNKMTAFQELHRKLEDVFMLLQKEDCESGLTRDAFRSVLKEESTKIWFNALDIDASDPEGLFELLDLDGNGSISKTEFIYGAAKLRGSSTQRDMFSVQALVERIEAKVDVLLPQPLRGRRFPPVSPRSCSSES